MTEVEARHPFEFQISLHLDNIAIFLKAIVQIKIKSTYRHPSEKIFFLSLHAYSVTDCVNSIEQETGKHIRFVKVRKTCRRGPGK